MNPLPSRWAAPLSGLIGAALAVAITELVGGLLPGGRSVFIAVGDAVIDGAPASVVGFAIDTFGTADRPVLLGSMAVVMALLGALIGWLAVDRPWVGPVGFVTFASLGGAAALADPLTPALTAVVAPAVGALAGTLVLAGLLGVSLQRDTGAVERASHPGSHLGSHLDEPSRRDVIGWMTAAAGAAVLFGVTGRFLQRRAGYREVIASSGLPVPTEPLPPPPAGASLDVAGISPLITPNDAFYRIDTALSVPRIDPNEHTVRITGMVDRPYEISFSELLELADTEADVTLSCVSNEVGGDLVDNARWLGVPLSEVLDRAGVQPGATQIVGRSVDGWTGGFPVEAAFDGRPALVAVGMNGEALPAEHGFPVRLVVAGLYGYVSDTKWLSELELTTFEEYDAYWIRRGWAQRAPIKTQSRIDVPVAGGRVDAGTVAVAGVAWAGKRGVSGVEVSIDGGDWRSAELAEELASTSWRQWLLRWDADPGSHTLQVRATDGDGETQTAQVAPPAPDGATGYHSVQVTVV